MSSHYPHPLPAHVEHSSLSLLTGLEHREDQRDSLLPPTSSTIQSGSGSRKPIFKASSSTTPSSSDTNEFDPGPGFGERLSKRLSPGGDGRQAEERGSKKEMRGIDQRDGDWNSNSIQKESLTPRANLCEARQRDEATATSSSYCECDSDQGPGSNVDDTPGPQSRLLRGLDDCEPFSSSERDVIGFIRRKQRQVIVDEEDRDDDIFIPGEDRLTGYVLTLVLCASISGLMFGVDTAIISGTLVTIGTDLSGSLNPAPLSNFEKEVITSSTTVGALIGSLFSGTTSDLIGRKPVIGIANVVFILGAISQTLATSVSTMTLGRVIVGFGVGLSSCIIPLYIGELSPTRLRGRLVTINVLAITLGQVVAYIIGAIFQHVPHGWRWMVGLTAVPAFGQLLSMSILPESPRFLLRRHRVESARRVLDQIYEFATVSEIDAKLAVLQASVKQSVNVMDSSTFRERLCNMFLVGSNRRALIVGGGLQLFQQLCGFNSLMYFSSTLFASLGFRNSTAVSSLVAIVNFIFTLLSLRIVDRAGRRRTMLLTTPVMVFALMAASLFFHRLTRETHHRLEEGAIYEKEWVLAVVGSMLVYVAGYAMGLGSIPWQQGEAFRLEMRGIGTSICTAVNWTGNLVISATFLSLMELITPSGAFGLYSVFCIVGWGFCYLCQPETAGLTLEEVCDLFEDDFGVDRSLEVRRQRLQAQKLIL